MVWAELARGRDGMGTQLRHLLRVVGKLDDRIGQRDGISGQYTLKSILANCNDPWFHCYYAAIQHLNNGGAPNEG